MSDYKELDVWKLAVELSVDVYTYTRHFPKSETYGLVDQLRRSSVSIASNVAEGSGRSTKKDFAHFIAIANGSACELETQIIIAYRIDFINKVELECLNNSIVRIRKMLARLRKSMLAAINDPR